MNSARRFLAIAGCFILFWGLSASAAQNGRIVSATAVIRDAPDAEAHGIGQAKQGDTVRISSMSKEGWFKILLPGTQDSPQYGWISAEELIPMNVAEDLRIGKVQPGVTKYEVDELDLGHQREWSMALFYHATTYYPRGLQNAAGVPNSSLSQSTFAAEVNLSPSQWVGLSFYVSMLSAAEKNAAAGTEYNLSAYFAGGIVEYYPVRTDSTRLGFGLGVLAVPVYLKLTRSDDAGGTTSGFQRFITVASAARASIRQNLTYHFGLQANLGYRYLDQKEIGIASIRTRLEMSGIYGELGFFLEF